MDTDHYLLVSAFIQSKIDDLELANSESAKENEIDLEDFPQPEMEEGSRQFSLGSVMKGVKVSEFEAAYSHDVAFNNFRRKLADHLTAFLQAYNIPLPENKQIRIHPDDKVSFPLRSIEFHYR